MPPSFPMVTVRDLTVEIDGQTILDRVTFHLAEGEILGIIGRSGAGKSVLMHLLRGVDFPPTSGAVIYHLSECRDCLRFQPRSLAGGSCPLCGGELLAVDVDLWNAGSDETRSHLLQKTAIMFQRTFALYGNDRVIENVLHALDDIEYPSERAVTRAADLLDRVRLSHRMMHIARDLSGGEKQRVVLARQLAKEPLLLFADEPTGTLDPDTARLVHELLVEAAKNEHMGMVITSHFPGVIEEVAGRALLLDSGRLEKDGAPAEVLAKFLEKTREDEETDRPPAGREILSARDVEKRYLTVDRGVIRAVDQVSFEVNEREIFGIIGTSGAGKTTLSRIISGIIEPTAGEMLIRIGDDWVDMTRPGITERGRAKPYIGLLHQEYDLYPHRTVVDNLTDAIGLDFPKELAVHKSRISLAMAGFPKETIDSLLNRYPSQLSEGERHRVALAQVLIREPRLIVLDEPTGTMDPLTREEVKDSILRARSDMDETFIVVSHDLGFVKQVCDRVALMRGGKIREIGPTHEVLAKISK